MAHVSGEWIGERGQGSVLEWFAQARGGRAFRSAGGMKGWPGQMALGLGFHLFNMLSPNVCLNRERGKTQNEDRRV